MSKTPFCEFCGTKVNVGLQGIPELKKIAYVCFTSCVYEHVEFRNYSKLPDLRSEEIRKNKFLLPKDKAKSEKKDQINKYLPSFGIL